MNAEQSIILSILLNPELIKELVVDDDYFSDQRNRTIIKTFKKCYEEYKTIDMTLLTNYQEILKNQLNDIINYLTDLLDNSIATANFQYYQEILHKEYISNKIIKDLNKFVSKNLSQEELISNIHKYEAIPFMTPDNSKTMEEIYDLITSKNKLITFRFPKLSEAANIQEHDFVVIAARPGIGKTGFILNLIEDLSNRYKCLLFNMEMSETQIYRRLVGINSKIPIKYHDNVVSEHQQKVLINGAKEIANKKITVFTGSQTINSIRNKIIKSSKEKHTLAFIDYVGLIRNDTTNQTNYERVTEIVKELRQISLDYNCTIFLVAQINRNSEKEKDKRPKISDLKESGELEQSATTVMMLHNENYYKKNVNSETEEIQIIIGKNRNGQTGTTTLEYNQFNQRFEVPRTTLKNLEEKK